MKIEPNNVYYKHANDKRYYFVMRVKENRKIYEGSVFSVLIFGAGPKK
jgi:hypothetical protein